jgi:ferric-dicitrate binding protein FerR (iron transport regulator)
MVNLTDLIKKLKEGTISSSEIASLLEYFKEREPKPGLQSLFRETWEESSEVNKEVDSKWIYNQVTDKIGITRVSDSKGSIKNVDDRLNLRNLKRYLKPALQYAAVFILAFILFWLVRPVPDPKESVSFENQFQRIVVPYGSKTKVELPDGSVIILNSGSYLSYSSLEFNSDKRTVILEGEGFFTVKKDPARPFYVNTRGMRLKVLGTTFNVKAYPDENIEEATLITGSVEIYANSDIKVKGKPIVLKPNERAIFSKSNQEINKLDTPSGYQVIEPVELKTIELQNDAKTEQVISWKDDKLIFNNEPFSSLVVLIERWFAVDITVDYPELNNARFTGKFDKETVEQVMSALSTITPFKFEIRKNQIIITK